MTDFIGDIHGHADKLEELLAKLGYQIINGKYSHPERNVVFVGDYIDRGPQIKRTLEIVKGLVDSGNATALMGNHEYNALCFHYENKKGGHLRKHLIKNIIQHYETLKQFQNSQEEYDDYLDWFKTLPLFYETEEFRTVHACWDQANIEFLKTGLVNNRLTDELIYQSTKEGTLLNRAIEVTLKGKEMDMPNGTHFLDKDGTERTEIRIKWWEDPAKSTYRNISIESLPVLPEIPIDVSGLKSSLYYHPDNKPVFFGQYWLKGNPSLYRGNVCCLDYSIAKHGKLACYRYDGEQELDNSKFVFV